MFTALIPPSGRPIPDFACPCRHSQGVHAWARICCSNSRNDGRSCRISVNSTANEFTNRKPCQFAALDGDQVLDFHWIDPIEAAKRFISRPKFKGKLYTQYERQNSTQRPGKRAFGRANAGLVFQTCQAVDKYSSPLLLLFYADKSFSGKHRTHHPIYSECLLCCKSISKPI